MKCLLWNCQGVGNPLTIHHLKGISKSHSPEIVFLSETKNKASTVQKFFRKCGYRNVEVFEPPGTSGGLALAWSNNCKVSLVRKNEFLLHCSVVNCDDDVLWHFVGVYLSVSYVVRLNQFSLLENYINSLTGCIVLGGDFNCIADRGEKTGGTFFNRRRMDEFNNFILNANLHDLGFLGHPFSWNNRRAGNQNIQMRLDRCLASMEWLRSYPSGKVTHLAELGSDHRPILLDSNPKVFRGRRRFYYDQRWAHNGEAKAIIVNAWNGRLDQSQVASNSENHLGRIQHKLKTCRVDLFSWAKTKNSNAYRNIQAINAEIDRMHRRGFNNHTSEIKELEARLAAEVVREEQFWHQKARINWLKWGDKNTAFFHSKVIQRRRRNNITQLHNRNGELCKDPGQIIEIALNHFKEIYTSTNPTGIGAVISGVQRKVTDGMNRNLTRPFSDREIRKAVFAINPNKAPGQDGMTGLFYQSNWDVIKTDVCAAVRSFLVGNRLPTGLNHTSITLIPKVQTPISMSDLRPISLCPVFYKIISRMLTTRLQDIIPAIISEHQSAFIKGRNISDNILLAHELTHYLKTRKGSSKFEFALKVDMSKAYERIEWIFVRRIMEKLGFHRSWIQWIMSCITSVTYSLNLNGGSHGFITPTRGLRQGDPLSPFLFLICAEGLSSLFTQAENSNQIAGVQISRRSPKISHLLFADDSLFFAQASVTQVGIISQLLNQYCWASGQEINHCKSSIFFSRNTPSDLQQQLARHLNVTHIGGQDKYLGLPSLVNKSKSETFREIVAKVRQKVAGWKENMLSYGGREVLIKSVATAIPVFAMSCFRLPLSICKEINKIIANFWWGQKNGERRMHWVSWKKMCKSKETGGLGFRDIDQFNLALLAKQGWRFISQPDSLITRVFKGKYFPFDSFLKAGIHSNSSWAWRSLLKGRQVLDKGVRWQVRSGQNIFIRNDPWLPTNFPFSVSDSSAIPAHVNRASDLILHQTHSWNKELVRDIFSPLDAATILAIPVSSTGADDKLIWNYTRNGIFNVKSAYHLSSPNSLVPNSSSSSSQVCFDSHVNWTSMWKLFLPPNIKVFIWKVLNDGIASNGNIHARMPSKPGTCPRCNSLESTIHMFLLCPFAEAVWIGSAIPHQADNIPPETMQVFWADLNARLTEIPNKNVILEKVVWTLWVIWVARNSFIFRNEDCDPAWILLKAVDLQEEFTRSQLQQLPSPPLIQTAVTNSLQWSPPPTNSYKINFDGAFNAESKTGTGACVARDHAGKVVCSIARRFHHVTCPTLVETLALREAISLAARMRFSDTIFEGDAKCIIDAMKNGSTVDIDSGVILDDCRTLCGNLSSYSFVFVRRSCNWAAHSIAKKALRDFAFCCNSLAQVLWLESKLL